MTRGLVAVLFCVACDNKYFHYDDKKSTGELCQTCVHRMSREEALAQVERFPHFHFCTDPAFYGYEPHPEGLYKQWVCKKCHLPTWANNDAHKICLGCGDKYTITSEHSNKDLCPNCI